MRDIDHVTSVFRTRSRGYGRHIFRYECRCGRIGMWVETELATWPARDIHERAMRRLSYPAAPFGRESQPVLQ